MRRAAQGVFPGTPGVNRIRIDIDTQTLELADEHGTLLRRYPVSTSKNGAGERNGSFCTPRGRHVVRAKIGARQPDNTVFKKRRPTGETFSPALAEQHPGRDWILTRILWLSGCEPGFNRLGEVDTMRRYIYIHGTPDTTTMGQPGSIGCIRMRNRDIVELFDLVEAGTPVEILSGTAEKTAAAR
jgi:L,D-transpeptidase YbiS